MDGYQGTNEKINSNVPTAREENLASDRFDAVRREEQRTDEINRIENLQKNSFDLFINSEDSSGCSPKVSSSSGGKSASVQSINFNRASSTSEEANENSKRKIAVKNRIMKQKREQLEEELGIDLSDYGYDRFSHKQEDNYENETSEEAEPIGSNEGGFFGLESNTDINETDIRAVIHGDYKNITSGTIIKMRLLDDLETGGVKVPPNTFVYGKLSFKNGRGNIQIQNINYRNKIIKFPGTVYDSDGFEGIYIPENIVSDTKKKAASDAVGAVDIDLTSKSKILKSTVSSVTNAIQHAVQGSIKEAKISISSNYSIIIKKKK
ncbi:MAG: conjugative transposon protein TraM [Paludibacteraceae bacterium]|nr:conjugative transposon protein TraM [Paludibacteraceae bacterium]